jgi:hypothetical protein
MQSQSGSVKRIFTLLLILTNLLTLMSCQTISMVPANEQTFEKYHVKLDDINTVTFYLSNQLVLKLSRTNSYYTAKGNSLDLNDEREDHFYTIPAATKGWNNSPPQKRQKLDFRHFKLVEYKVYYISFDVEDLGKIVLPFVEDGKGFMRLNAENNKKMKLGDNEFTCIDGCNSFLLMRAHENDSYRGIDQTESNSGFFGKALLAFLALAAALTIFTK